MKEKRTCKDACELTDEQKRICTDPNGSWTGVPVDESEEPIQDADDL